MLKVFLAIPQVAIGTKPLERALRVIPMACINYLFCWSELGAEQLGLRQSLMVTCRLQGVNPNHYLVDVLHRVIIHPAKDLIELIPKSMENQIHRFFLTSDLAKKG